MTKLLVQGGVILAKEPFTEHDDCIITHDPNTPYEVPGIGRMLRDDLIVYKHTITGWQIVDVEVPDGFTCAGYTFDGARVVQRPPVVVPPVVPQVVTMRQARLALLGAGLLDTVTTQIAALPSPQKEAATIEWEYSQEVHRSKELVCVLAPMLGLTDAQIDQLFITAATL